MPMRITKTCRHCGGAVDQDDYFGDWFHTGRADTGGSTDMACDPAKTTGNQATPTLTVEPRTTPAARFPEGGK